jgi:hypothetical protein
LIKIKLKAILLCLLLTSLLVASCSNEPALKLTDVSVDIVTDEGVSGSENVGKGENAVKLVPTVLYYEFTIENTRRSSIGSFEKQLQLFIKHDTDLIPNLDLYGFGYSNSPVIPPNESAEYKIHYALGIGDRKGIRTAKPLPDQEQLDEILSKALDATLIVVQLPSDKSMEGRTDPFVLNEDAEELIRFDLKDFKN